MDDQYDYHFSEGGTWEKIIYNPFPAAPTFSNTIAILYNKFIPDVDAYKFPTEADLNTIYSVGTSKVFSISNNGSYNADGWRISIDDNGTFWDSYDPAADQSASYVTIESRGNETINGQNAYTVKGSFSCTVYDHNGHSKILSGKFYQFFSDYSSY